MNSRREDNSRLFDNSTLCAQFMDMMSDCFSGSYTAFFFLFCTNRAQSLYLVTVFPSSIHKFFIHPFYFYFTEAFTSSLQQLFAFIFVLQGKSYFEFLLLVFISHTTRISNKTSFLCKRLVVKKNKFNFKNNFKLETIFPVFQN